MSTTAPRSLLPIDVEVLRQTVRWTMLRPVHAVAMTGASPWTVRASLRRLTAAELVTSQPITVTLQDPRGQLRRSITWVYVATGRGASYAGEWVVPGTDGVVVSLPAPRPSAALADHMLGVADLACWYRTFGFEVAAEREILSLERPSKLVPDRVLAAHWSVPVPGRVGIHPPDLGAVGPGGTRWAVELERATKTVNQYVQVVGAYRAAGIGQVWHVLSNATAKRLLQACHLLGIRIAPRDGASASEDGLVRLQGWLPGRSAGGGPETWAAARLVPQVPPAGIAAPGPRPDLSLQWRRGAVVDPDDDVWGPESVMIA